MGLTKLAELPPADIERTLEQIVFTAAHSWRRSVSIDAAVRDLLVRALRFYRQHGPQASTAPQRDDCQ
jgi:hypothetical protein